ncbi:energy transducer TonB [Marinoscillum furvescens]|nr:energy transducer TonB [Marinoscillum furvescens]
MENKKVKIVRHIEHLHDGAKHSNFEALYDQYTDYRATLVKYKIVGAVCVSIAVTAIIYLLASDLTKPEKIQMQTHELMRLAPKPLQHGLATRLPDRLDPNAQIKTKQSELPVARLMEQKEESTGSEEAVIPDTVSIDTSPSMSVFRAAQPIAGISHLLAYLQANIIYPEAHKPDSISGTVVVGFTVLEDSTIGAIKVVQSLGALFDEEAKRVVRHMPTWQPAMQNQKPVKQDFTIPITFQLFSEQP